MSCYGVEALGWITLVILVAKTVHNVGHFIYTALLGSLLGRNIQLSKCGPWAGTPSLTK